MIGPALAAPAAPDTSSFQTSAKLSVDGNVLSFQSGVATIQPRLGAPGYSWLRINFYSFPLSAEDVAGAMNGNVETIHGKGNAKGSPAVIQLAVDQAFKVWQVDMSVPGHTCTIAPFEQDVRSFLQTYQFDGKNLRLKSKGTYVCDMKFMGIANQTFGWDIDLRVPVFKKVNTGK
jgi:hypothetical protein